MLDQQPALDPVFRALADGTRRQLVEQLGHGPASVSSLAEPLDMTLAAVVQHLQVLETAGVIYTEKKGRTRTCSLNTERLEQVERWLSDRRSTWQRRFDRLGELLGEPEEPKRGRRSRKES